MESGGRRRDWRAEINAKEPWAFATKSGQGSFVATADSNVALGAATADSHGVATALIALETQVALVAMVLLALVALALIAQGALGAQVTKTSTTVLLHRMVQPTRLCLCGR